MTDLLTEGAESYRSLALNSCAIRTEANVELNRVNMTFPG